MPTEDACIQLKPGKLFDSKTVCQTGTVPVLNQSEDGFLGYHDGEPGVVASMAAPVVTFANHTCAMRLMKQPFSTIQNIFPKIGRPGVTDTTYFYYAALGRVVFSDYKGHHPLFRQAQIPIPPLPIQRRIAGILSAYDELIENSQRRIKILESMARGLYREWFVHFRFPGHESVPRVPSPLGEIPQGWEVKTVQQIVKRIPVGTKYDQKTVSSTGAVPVFDQGKSGVIGYHDEKPGVVASETAPVIVFANHTCYQRLIHIPFSAIQNVLPFVPSPSMSRNIYWLHWATNGLVVFNDYKGHWPEFAAQTLIVPPPTLCQQFGDFAMPLSLRILKLDDQIQNLRRTRDLLLPRLLSGQIDVEALNAGGAS
jgi:restriction endonuclease S subunit